MNFEHALALIRDGGKVRRLAWKRGKWIEYQPAKGNTMHYLALVYEREVRAPWTPTQCDLLLGDWVQV